MIVTWHLEQLYKKTADVDGASDTRAGPAE